MKISVKQNNDNTVLAYTSLIMEGEFTIYNATDIKENLLPYFTQDGDVEIDLSQVTDIDSAGIQLLLLAKREISGDDRELRLTGHSRAVLDVFELYNLAAHFGDPLLISGKDRAYGSGNML